MSEICEVTVNNLCRTPIAGLRPEPLEQLTIASNGLFGNGEYMLVDTAQSNERGAPCIDTKGENLLASFEPKLLDDVLYVTWLPTTEGNCIPQTADTPEHLVLVRTPHWSGMAVDQGDEAADIFTRHLTDADGVRLVRISEHDKRHTLDDPFLNRIGFLGKYPLSIVAQSSLDQINEWLAEDGRPAVTAHELGISMIVDSPELEPFRECELGRIVLCNANNQPAAQLLHIVPRMQGTVTDLSSGDRVHHTLIDHGRSAYSKHHFSDSRTALKTFLGAHFHIDPLGRDASVVAVGQSLEIQSFTRRLRTSV